MQRPAHIKDGKNYSFETANIITHGIITPFQGCTDSASGKRGLVPEPLAGEEDKVLQGGGTWGKKLQIDIVKQGTQYGYIDSDNNFVSFKSQADIDAAVSAARVGNATAADVVSGKTFTNSLGSGLVGTFTGQSKTVNPLLSEQTVTPDSGKYLSQVVVSAGNISFSFAGRFTSDSSPTVNVTVTPNTSYVLLFSFGYLSKTEGIGDAETIEVVSNFTINNRANSYNERPINYLINSSTRIRQNVILFGGKSGNDTTAVFKISDGVTMPEAYDLKCIGYKVNLS